MGEIGPLVGSYKNKGLEYLIRLLTNEVYVGLFTTLPSKDFNGIEVSGGGYKRQPVSFIVISEAGGSIAINSEKVEFPKATTDWGVIRGCGIFDKETDGNLIAFYPADIYQYISAKNIFLIPAKGLAIPLY